MNLLSYYIKKVVRLFLSETTEPIGISILGKPHISLRMVLGYFYLSFRLSLSTDSSDVTTIKSYNKLLVFVGAILIDLIVLL